MNNIATSQNKEENLLLLYSQKILYDKSKTIKYILIIFAVLNVLLYTVPINQVKYKSSSSMYICFISFYSIYLQNKLSKFNSLASSTQELVDRRLFNFEINKRDLDNHTISELISCAKNLKDKYPQKYIDNINNTGIDTPNGVKDWYKNIPSSLPLNEAILKCQKQNIYWDKYLTKQYKKTLIVLSISVVAIYLYFYWYKIVYNLITGICSYIPIIIIVIKEFTNLKTYTDSNNKIDTIIDTLSIMNCNDIDKLKDLQYQIFFLRKFDINIPSIIHKINVKRLHTKYKQNN